MRSNLDENAAQTDWMDDASRRLELNIFSKCSMDVPNLILCAPHHLSCWFIHAYAIVLVYVRPNSVHTHRRNWFASDVGVIVDIFLQKIEQKKNPKPVDAGWRMGYFRTKTMGRQMAIRTRQQQTPKRSRSSSHFLLIVFLAIELNSKWRNEPANKSGCRTEQNRSAQE